MIGDRLPSWHPCGKQAAVDRRGLYPDMSEGVQSSDAIPDTLVRQLGPVSAAATSRALPATSARVGGQLRRNGLTQELKHIERTNVLDMMVEVRLSATNGHCDEAAE